MKLVILSAVVALAAGLAPDLAEAKSKGHCPPGLAKKSTPCVPPGLAKKGVTNDRYGDDDAVRLGRDTYVDRDGYVRIREYKGYRTGDYYVDRDGYVRVRDYDRYRLPRLNEGETYYRDGNVVFRVDRETRRIIEMIRLAELVFGN